MKFSRNPDSGDPSNIQQSFEKIDVHVHCCRYWWLKQWKHQRLSFPYWRLYWNKIPGAYVFFENRVHLDPDRIVLIPPHTPFYTGILRNEPTDDAPYCMEGGWIHTRGLESDSIEKGHILHFFIHFNLGYHFDNTRPGIYPVPRDEIQTRLLSELTDYLMQGSRTFTLQQSIAVYNLVLSSIRKIPDDSWEEPAVGNKIQNVMNHIMLHLDRNMTNEELARLIHMAPNSFSRLFKRQTGHTPQVFIRNKRVEHACRLLYHTDKNIKQISWECGFRDRYYFTRVFSAAMGIPPARYRKNLLPDRSLSP